MAASATFALKTDVWFRRGRLLIVSPDSSGKACPLSGRNSTYRPVQISEASSHLRCRQLNKLRRGLHAQQFMGVVKRGAGVGTGNLDKLEIVVCGALGDGCVSILE